IAAYDEYSFTGKALLRIGTDVVDTTPPTVTAPDANFRPATQIGTTTTPVSLKVKFTAADASGISATDLEQSVNAAAFGDVPLKTATSTGANVSVAPSNATTRQFRARATDGAGNTSGFATGPLFKVKAIQNGSASIVQTGTWTTESLSSFYGGSVRYASAAGAKQSVTTTMNDAAIVTTKGPNRGKAGVYVDGVLKTTLDLYSSATAYRQVVYAISFPGAATSHKVELRALGTKNASSSGTRVDLDALLLMTP
ncbi:MAG: hypothetical protein H0V04_08055, partial [Chloroflexi bacterium]|nr:hypothetical protein [Chloroflexota bacterium]